MQEAFLFYTIFSWDAIRHWRFKFLYSLVFRVKGLFYKLKRELPREAEIAFAESFHPWIVYLVGSNLQGVLFCLLLTSSSSKVLLTRNFKIINSYFEEHAWVFSIRFAYQVKTLATWCCGKKHKFAVILRGTSSPNSGKQSGISQGFIKLKLFVVWVDSWLGRLSGVNQSRLTSSTMGRHQDHDKLVLWLSIWS